jgi:hypothetical protein
VIQLLDREAFPDEDSITRDRVRPFLIRTEKRESIDAEGQPLFKPRMTRPQAVTWQPRHAARQRLCESVTDCVRHSYNQAMAARQRHIGFLMILMQRLVTQAAWGSLERVDKGRRIMRRTPMTISHDGLTAWLIEAVIGYTGKAMSVGNVQSAAVLYPSKLDQPLAFVASKSPALELRAGGSRSQIVAIK